MNYDGYHLKRLNQRNEENWVVGKVLRDHQITKQFIENLKVKNKAKSVSKLINSI
jgi:hypothetical protein